MKISLVILLLFSFGKGQDSLFWFDMNTVRDPVPNTPKVLDQIFGTSQLGILDSLKNFRVNTQDGYRLQIYETSQVDDATRYFKKSEKTLPDSVYMIFEAPLYKIRYGNFVTKKDADIQKTKLRRSGYKDVWIVKSRIEHLEELTD